MINDSQGDQERHPLSRVTPANSTVTASAVFKSNRQLPVSFMPFQSIASSTFPMDLSNQKKPSLPRLSTNIPLESQSTPLLPLLPKLQDTNVRPKRERPVTLPSPFPGGEENISPTVRDVPEPKLICSTKGPEDAPVKKRSHYHEGAFTTRGPHHSPQDQIPQDSVVVAELKTNCRVC